MKSRQTRLSLSWIRHWHTRFIFQRRAQVLSDIFAAQIPRDVSLLDIGCGDGTISGSIGQLRPDIRIQGVEVMERPECRIPCTPFDGVTLPFPDSSFDVCILVDVLHHTNDVLSLLREACRVSRHFILLKDHLCEGAIDAATLRLMDWVGNHPHGVKLTYNYQTRKQWRAYFAECGLHEASWTTQVPLYKPPLSYLAERKLHFISLLEKAN